MFIYYTGRYSNINHFWLKNLKTSFKMIKYLLIHFKIYNMHPLIFSSTFQHLQFLPKCYVTSPAMSALWIHPGCHVSTRACQAATSALGESTQAATPALGPPMMPRRHDVTATSAYMPCQHWTYCHISSGSYRK